MKILILGGNRFFGKCLAEELLSRGHSLTLLNRGTLDDGLGPRVERLHCDRNEPQALAAAIGQRTWDVVYDQVCFDYRAAQQACEIFAAKTARYIFTSSKSVYKLGPNLRESDFRPEAHPISSQETSASDYAEAKRQAEVGFSRHAKFPVTTVRLPLVLGLGDYTGRLAFHIRRVREGLPIYFPNPGALISLVSAEFAGSALASLAEKPLLGPLNVASSEPIRLLDFLGMVESCVGRKAVLATEATEENHSPYGFDRDSYLNCDRLAAYGLRGPAIWDWLPPLIRAFKQG